VSEPSNKADRRQTAKRHTAHLLAILQGKTKAESTATPAPDDRVYSTTHSAPTVPPRVAEKPPPSAQPKQPPPPSLKPVSDHLSPSSGHLSQLIAQTQRLAQLNTIFLAYLPPHLREHAALARADAEAWVVQTDSSAWATRLRYSLPSVRRPFSEHIGVALPPPRIRIAPPAVAPPPPPPSRRMTVSAQTVDTLESAARELNDTPLGAAMKRLAEHARQRHNQTPHKASRKPDDRRDG